MRQINGIKMFSSKEIRELLGISVQALSGLRRKGLIRSVRMWGELYTSEQSLNDYLNGLTLPKPTAKGEHKEE